MNNYQPGSRRDPRDSQGLPPLPPPGSRTRKRVRDRGVTPSPPPSSRHSSRNGSTPSIDKELHSPREENTVTPTPVEHTKESPRTPRSGTETVGKLSDTKVNASPSSDSGQDEVRKKPSQGEVKTEANVEKPSSHRKESNRARRTLTTKKSFFTKSSDDSEEKDKVKTSVPTPDASKEKTTTPSSRARRTHSPITKKNDTSSSSDNDSQLEKPKDDKEESSREKVQESNNSTSSKSTIGGFLSEEGSKSDKSQFLSPAKPDEEKTSVKDEEHTSIRDVSRPTIFISHPDKEENNTLETATVVDSTVEHKYPTKETKQDAPIVKPIPPTDHTDAKQDNEQKKKDWSGGTSMTPKGEEDKKPVKKKRRAFFLVATTWTMGVVAAMSMVSAWGYSLWVDSSVTKQADIAYEEGARNIVSDPSFESVVKISENDFDSLVGSYEGKSLPEGYRIIDRKLIGWTIPGGTEYNGRADVEICWTSLDLKNGGKKSKVYLVSEDAQNKSPKWIIDAMSNTGQKCSASETGKSDSNTSTSPTPSPTPTPTTSESAG